MPGLDPGILFFGSARDDGGLKPGHDEERGTV
jgi:hypothetical protein